MQIRFILVLIIFNLIINVFVFVLIETRASIVAMATDFNAVSATAFYFAVIFLLLGR